MRHQRAQSSHVVTGQQPYAADPIGQIFEILHQQPNYDLMPLLVHLQSLLTNFMHQIQSQPSHIINLD